MKFPCNCCGQCCRKIGEAVHNAHALGLPDEVCDFPYAWDEQGVCEMLEDNKCKVYENRPLLCNVSAMQKYFNLSKKEFIKLNKQACKMLQSVGPC